MARVVHRCEWSGYPCSRLAQSRSAYCAEHHARVFQTPKPGDRRIGIGPLTKEAIQKAQARRKAKLRSDGRK